MNQTTQDISNTSIILLGSFVLIVLGSVIVSILPNHIVTQCLTPDQWIIINGVAERGLMISCP